VMQNIWYVKARLAWHGRMVTQECFRSNS
jgi:hypothetical protein